MTSKIIYKGDLRTEATHLQSGTVIQTDAPVDNHGKGEKFSPTDLVATALGSCMLTFMGISAQGHNINIDGTHCEVTKEMVANPRKIGRIVISMYMKGSEAFTDKQKAILEASARSCAVLESLHPDTIKDLTFIW